jgi:hypothetical protein
LRLNLVDDDADPLQTIVLKGPAKGLIYGSGTNLFYLPRTGALGADQFTYKAWDGQKFGNPATVSLYISLAPNSEPPGIDEIHIVGDKVQIQLTTPSLAPFHLESSTDLLNWLPLSGTITPQTFTIVVTDTNAPSSVKFYRARQE